MDLAPSLYVIPKELNPFEALFLRLGVQQSFSADQYIGFLERMHSTAGSNPLSQKQLGQAISVIQVCS